MPNKYEELEELLARLGMDMTTFTVAFKSVSMDINNVIKFLQLLGQVSDHKGGLKEPFIIQDRLILKHFDKDGNLKGERDSGWSPFNGITNAGMASVAGLILTDVGDTAYDYIAIGTGATAFSPTQTTLVTETEREAGTGTLVTTTVTNDTAQLVRTFSGYSGSEGIQESGVFNDASVGDMLCRQTFSVLNIDWDAGDSLQVTWKIQVKQGS